MKILIPTLLMLPAVALAGSNFDGTWKMRLDSVKVTGRPDSYLLADGTYTCASCDPLVTVKADGADHAVAGQAYYDSATVKVINPSTVEIIYHRAGKVSVKETDTVSADGKSYTGKYANYDGAKEVTQSFTEKRVSAGPAGSHAISGEWLQDQQGEVSAAGTIISFEMGAEDFKLSYNGQSYDAKFDGKKYPMVGDPGGTSVSLKRIDANTVEETDHRKGKAVSETRWAAAKDGKTLQVTYRDLALGQTTTYTLDKQ